MKIILQYRCGANYKTSFEHDVPDGFPLTVGEEFNMGEYGTPKWQEFFNSEIHPYKFNPKFDHGILEIIKVGEE